MKNQLFTKKIKTTDFDGKVLERDVTFLIGRGENCQCSDCPVLYGGECPFDSPKK